MSTKPKTRKSLSKSPLTSKKNGDHSTNNTKVVSKKPKTSIHLSKQTKITPNASIDLLTGKELVNCYFDSKILLQSEEITEEYVNFHLYEVGKVIKEDANIFTIRLSDGQIFKVSKLLRVHQQDNEGVDDILKLKEFSEMSLIQTLRVRYLRDDIYTFVGSILISFNPYKWLPEIYSETKMSEYHKNTSSNYKSPHLFTIAQNAYQTLMESRMSKKPKNQAIIISGESGAGKTEATKVIMTYLARVTAMDNADTNNIGELEQRVLNTNPILEAFGNAKTLRNDNSSRFGKFIKIEFSSNGRISGAVIEKYLLEKTRIIYQIEGERSYHIFYQLIKGADSDMKKKLNLSNNIYDYTYLQSSVSDVPSINDMDEYKITLNCMKSVDISSEIQNEIFGLLASILHLGNVEFEQDDEEGQVGNIKSHSMESFDSAASILGIKNDELLFAMTKQNMHVGGSTIVKIQSQAQVSLFIQYISYFIHFTIS